MRTRRKGVEKGGPGRLDRGTFRAEGGPEVSGAAGLEEPPDHPESVVYGPLEVEEAPDHPEWVVQGVFDLTRGQSALEELFYRHVVEEEEGVDAFMGSLDAISRARITKLGPTNAIVGRGVDLPGPWSGHVATRSPRATSHIAFSNPKNAFDPREDSSLEETGPSREAERVLLESTFSEMTLQLA